MKIINGIAYAENNVEFMEVTDVKVLDDMMLILSFNNQEERLYDATELLSMPVFSPLKNEDIFKNPKIIDGILTWLDGEIDISSETLYKNSFKYDKIISSY